MRFLSISVRVVLDFLRDARVEDVHADVEQLVGGNLGRRLRRLQHGHRPRFLDAARREQRAREQIQHSRSIQPITRMLNRPQRPFL